MDQAPGQRWSPQLNDRGYDNVLRGQIYRKLRGVGVLDGYGANMKQLVGAVNLKKSTERRAPVSSRGQSVTDLTKKVSSNRTRGSETGSQRGNTISYGMAQTPSKSN
jgi:hypothetical protein